MPSHTILSGSGSCCSEDSSSTNVTVGDTWEWDGKSWREIKSKTLPPIRRRHALAWMGSAGKVMLHGGVVHNTALKTGETWAWNGVDWHKRHLQGNPGQKEWIGLVYDERRQQLVLYGGGSGGYKWDETWLYTSKPAVPAKFTAYGSGCKGTVGVPSLTLEGQHLPFIGEVLQMRLSPLPKAAFNVPLGILGGSRTQWGAAKLPLSMTPFGLAGCSLYVSYDIPILLTNQGGTALWKQPLPYEPSLIGNRFYAQALVLDIGANKANLIMSNAAELLLGDR